LKGQFIKQSDPSCLQPSKAEKQSIDRFDDYVTTISAPFFNAIKLAAEDAIAKFFYIG